jgi:hypothetical protein
MIKVSTQTINVSLHKLVKANEADVKLDISPEILANIEELVTSLIDDPTIVVDVDLGDTI